MTPLQEKFLKANNELFIADGGLSLAKASEQICIEEKIELLDRILKRLFYGFNESIVIYIIQIKSELQNQLNNLK